MTERRHPRSAGAFAVAASTVALFLVVLIALAHNVRPVARDASVAAVRPRPVLIRRVIVTRRVVVIRHDAPAASHRTPQRVVAVTPAVAPRVIAPPPAPAPAPAPVTTHTS